MMEVYSHEKSSKKTCRGRFRRGGFRCGRFGPRRRGRGFRRRRGLGERRNRRQQQNQYGQQGKYLFHRVSSFPYTA